jgi:hypothetical protein
MTSDPETQDKFIAGVNEILTPPEIEVGDGKEELIE